MQFACNNQGCGCKTGTGPRHFGRVRSVGINRRKKSTCARRGKVELEIQQCLWSDHSIFDNVTLDPQLEPNEIVMTWVIHFVIEANVFAINKDSVTYDYRYADDKLANPTASTPKGAFIRRTLNIEGALTPGAERLPVDHDFEETPLCRQAPLRGELEIQTHSRQYFVDLDNYARTGIGQVWSLPYFSFIDGFGAYLSLYRTIVGIYHLLCCLTLQERQRRATVFPLTLSPHGSNLAEVNMCPLTQSLN